MKKMCERNLQEVTTLPLHCSPDFYSSLSNSITVKFSINKKMLMIIYLKVPCERLGSGASLFCLIKTNIGKTKQKKVPEIKWWTIRALSALTRWARSKQLGIQPHRVLNPRIWSIFEEPFQTIFFLTAWKLAGREHSSRFCPQMVLVHAGELVLIGDNWAW